MRNTLNSKQYGLNLMIEPGSVRFNFPPTLGMSCAFESRLCHFERSEKSILLVNVDVLGNIAILDM
jgi:hypothetical protein